MRVAHVITGLGVGGAETMLSRLLEATDPGDVTSSVVTLTTRGPMAERIEASGVPVEAIDVSPRNPLRGLAALRRNLGRFEPDLVQTWMYHADLLGGIAARSLGLPSVWSLRQSHLGREGNRVSTLLVMAACARLSGTLPEKIICGSEAARRAHVRVGYTPEKMVMIPNGFDTRLFRPVDSLRIEVRREMSIDPDWPVVGLVARFDPQKDHRTFVAATKEVFNRLPETVFVLCGLGVDDSNRALTELIEATGSGHRFRLLGPVDGLHRLMQAFDVSVSSSIGEGLPNAIGEAMACGVPCVVTDVGDSRKLVGDTGLVVPSRDPSALANAVIALLEEDASSHARRAEAARARIEQHFGIAGAVEAHVALWRDVVSKEVAGCAG